MKKQVTINLIQTPQGIQIDFPKGLFKKKEYLAGEIQQNSVCLGFVECQDSSFFEVEKIVSKSIKP